jgi:hypothetical protein
VILDLSKRYRTRDIDAEVTVVAEFGQRVCKNGDCDATFIPVVGNQVFCTNHCRDVWYANFPQRYYELRPTKLKRCVQCGKEFLSNNRKKAYCSAECQRAHLDVAYVKKAQEVRTCAYCGSEFLTSHGTQRYCCAEHRRLKHATAE